MEEAQPSLLDALTQQMRDDVKTVKKKKPNQTDDASFQNVLKKAAVSSTVNATRQEIKMFTDGKTDSEVVEIVIELIEHAMSEASKQSDELVTAVDLLTTRFDIT